MINISGVVILFYPTEQTIFNVSTYVNQLEYLYVLDNSEILNESIKVQLSKFNNVIYLHDGFNNGIAARLNQAIQLAKEKNIDWLLTMDQDSYFENETLKKYKEYISLFASVENVAMFGLSYENRILAENNDFENANQLITSASILNINLTKKIGYFDEKLFIDEVDSDYCFRARFSGYQIIRFKNLQFKHNLGEIKQGISLKSFSYTPRTLHSPIRLYYMVRNYLYLIKKYPELDKNQKKLMRDGLLLRIKNNMIYNNKRVSVVKYILKAYHDFKNEKMGKYTNSAISQKISKN